MALQQLAGEIFKKVSGQPLVAFLRGKIFQPLDMASASDWPPEQPSDAKAYTRYALGPPRPARRDASGWYFAAGELAITPSDLANWDVALLQHKLLSARSLGCIHPGGETQELRFDRLCAGSGAR